ncbi:GntR family transcriptional regulator [Peptacetobacter hominis]|uniref:GntR family transcriptional regulator n=1 Tax=Peptacetobacter hominis TaxID=2743610 RepID=A0A544QYV8_9FIRM|nr:GntR family transcriptional regulator [Peptacetobacter hominis]TQQ85850.1 GntR family transcriptional regulator [Peptacetobacter hominis]
MKINLDFNSDRSIYIQIKESILKSIAKGELHKGESLPSVRNLSESIGVNLHTVNKSYNELKDSGFLNIDRRKGAIVANLPLEPDEKTFSDIEKKLEILVYEAFLSGMDKESFIDLCGKIYDECEVSEK